MNRRKFMTVGLVGGVAATPLAASLPEAPPYDPRLHAPKAVAPEVVKSVEELLALWYDDPDGGGGQFWLRSALTQLIRGEMKAVPKARLADDKEIRRAVRMNPALVAVCSRTNPAHIDVYHPRSSYDFGRWEGLKTHDTVDVVGAMATAQVRSLIESQLTADGGVHSFAPPKPLIEFDGVHLRLSFRSYRLAPAGVFPFDRVVESQYPGHVTWNFQPGLSGPTGALGPAGPAGSPLPPR